MELNWEVSVLTLESEGWRRICSSFTAPFRDEHEAKANSKTIVTREIEISVFADMGLRKIWFE